MPNRHPAPDRNDPLSALPDVARCAREEKLRHALQTAYQDDLREMLASPCGARVLFHWLDAAGVFGLVSAGGENTIRAAAISDFGKLRLLEIHRANPEGYIKIMRAVMDTALAHMNTEQEENHG